TLVSTVLVADFVSVDSRAGATCNCANERALFSTNQGTEKCATDCAPRSSDLVAVLVPNGAILAIIVVVVIDIVAHLISALAGVVSAICATVVSRSIRVA